jgi:hypothetical protein
MEPDCVPTGGNNVATFEKKLQFVFKTYGAALNEADSIDNALGGTVNAAALAQMFVQWSADESNYGADPSDVAENNYFGIQNKANTAGLFGGSSVTCNRNNNPIASNSQNACFASDVTWGQELAIALGPSASTGVTYLSALETALKNGASMGQALQAIANNGYNSANPNYGNYITSNINIQSAINCVTEIWNLK